MNKKGVGIHSTHDAQSQPSATSPDLKGYDGAQEKALMAVSI